MTYFGNVGNGGEENINSAGVHTVNIRYYRAVFK